VGGEPADDFVRSWVDHIARQSKDEEMKGQFWVAVNKVLKPLISDRGLRWEMHVDEDTVQPVDHRGPPLPDTPAEQKWRAENKASAYEPG